MIKHKGNFLEAQNELKNNDNNALAYLFENETFNQGILSDAVVTIKDNYATIDAPTQASSKILEGFRPLYNATVVEKLIQAGAKLVAKVHLDELSLGGTGEHSAYGMIVNPLDNKRLVGGSSSGSAATFTNNISLAIGSDTGDSVRLPASYVGKVGFKPSYGAISRYGLFAFASSLDTVGFFTHNIDDAITTSKVLFGSDEKDLTSKNVPLDNISLLKPKKVGFLNDYGLLDKDVMVQFNNLKIKLRNEGVEVVDISIDEKLLRSIEPIYLSISFAEVSSNDANLNGIAFGKREEGSNWSEIMFNSRSENFGLMVQRRMVLGAYYLLKENQEEIFLKAQKVRRVITDTFNNIYNDVDILLFPSASVAPLISEGKPDNWTSSYLTAANLSGTPSISIPWIKVNDLPVNLSLDTKIYDDAKLLSHALYFENLFKGENNE